jgi:signal transduction histidine kinase
VRSRPRPPVRRPGLVHGEKDARDGAIRESFHPNMVPRRLAGTVGQAARSSGADRPPEQNHRSDTVLIVSETIDTSRSASGTMAGVFEALDAATRAVAGLQSVDDVLQVIVDQVRPLVGARYAALGIVAADGVIERFITSGIDAEERARIGALPRGRGLLGLIMREHRSFRIRDIATDARRHGFPPNHPDMHSFLGVPVTVRGASVGNLYLTEKLGADEFSEDDQRLVETFALHAGIAIENARVHEQAELLAVVDERERIGADLHDGIIQSLYAVGLSLEDVPELVRDDPDEVERRVEQAIDSLHLTIQDIRNFIFGLRPALLGGTELAAGLVAIAEEFRHNSMIDLELDLAAVDEPDPTRSPTSSASRMRP